MKTGVWTILIQSLVGMVAMASDPIITADLAPREAWVGDPVTLTLNIHFDDDWDIELFQLDERMDGAHVLSQVWSEVVKNPETQLNHLEFRAQLAWYKLGDFILNDIELQATKGSGSSVRLKVPDLAISIEAMLEDDDTSLAPPKGQISIPSPLRMGLIFALVVAALAIMAAVILTIKRPKKKEPEKIVPRQPPLEEALTNLKALTHGSLLKEGKTKAFYVEISQIIHVLYSRLFGIPAEEMTSLEIDEWLREREIEASLLEVNGAFHDLCDAVKFARYEPKQAENTEVVNRAHRIIDLLSLNQEEESNVAAG